MSRQRWVYWVLAAAFSVSGFAAERFPPPQFETDYQMPQMTQPESKILSLQTMDVLVLAVFLGIASWLTLRRRSRRWIVGLMVVSLLYFGFIRQGCVCPIGAVGNVTLSIFDASYAIPLGIVLFFALPLITALFFGRSFCAGVCPLGAVQDLVLLKPVKVPYWLETSLRMIAWLFLGLAVLFAATGSGFLICRYDPFVSLFRMSANSSMWLLTILFVGLSLFVGRAYCRFLCPLGLLLRQCGRVSRYHVTITPDECIHCRLCEDACPFGAIDKPTEKWPQKTLLSDRRRLGLVILAAPVLIAGGAWIGWKISPVLAGANPTVHLAEQIQARQSNPDLEPTEETTAFAGSGKSVESLFQQQAAIEDQFAFGSLILGGFLGLITAGKLVMHSIRVHREDYQANRASCFGCGRCFRSCPRHRMKENRTNG